MANICNVRQVSSCYNLHYSKSKQFDFKTKNINECSVFFIGLILCTSLWKWAVTTGIERIM